MIKIRSDSVAMKLLTYLDAAEDIASTIFAPPHKWARWAWCGKYSTYKGTIYRLVKSGFLEIIEEADRKVLSLTPKGKMQVLVAKASLAVPQKWDGKWRMILFDIPEKNKVERQQLRRLLLKNNFKKMQSSVYISPWALNREAITYLKETGLFNYIRIGRIDELDDDKDFRHKFKLNI